MHTCIKQKYTHTRETIAPANGQPPKRRLSWPSIKSSTRCWCLRAGKYSDVTASVSLSAVLPADCERKKQETNIHGKQNEEKRGENGKTNEKKKKHGEIEGKKGDNYCKTRQGKFPLWVRAGEYNHGKTSDSLSGVLPAHETKTIGKITCDRHKWEKNGKKRGKKKGKQREEEKAKKKTDKEGIHF